MTDDLWGELPNAIEIETPAEILQAQAALLTKKTKQRLTARVNTVDDSRLGPFASFARDIPTNALDDSAFRYRFVIVAPALNNYIYSVLEIGHSIKLYPVLVFDFTEKRIHQCPDADVYRKTIGSILQSADTHQAIASLLKQIGNK
jgi:hypothetical protein